MSVLQTRRDLFRFILAANISQKEKDNYLEYLFNQDPLVHCELLKLKKYLSFSVANRRITVVNKPLPLKSFFEGKEGVKFIRHEDSCFETQILPDLPEKYTPKNSFTATKFDVHGGSILIPYVQFNGTYENLLATEGFSLHDMLAVFLVGIQQDEKFFIRKERKTVYDVALGPSEPFFLKNSVGTSPFDPTGNFNYLHDFSVSYKKEEGAWEVLFWNGGD